MLGGLNDEDLDLREKKVCGDEDKWLSAANVAYSKHMDFIEANTKTGKYC